MSSNSKSSLEGQVDGVQRRGSEDRPIILVREASDRELLWRLGGVGVKGLRKLKKTPRPRTSPRVFGRSLRSEQCQGILLLYQGSLNNAAQNADGVVAATTQAEKGCSSTL